MADGDFNIPGQADIPSNDSSSSTASLPPPPPKPQLPATQPQPATPATGTFDLNNLPDVVQTAGKSAMDATNNFINTAQSAAPIIKNINQNFSDVLTDVNTKQSDVYGTLMDARQKLEYTAAHPFSKFMGLWNPDYNEEYQKARMSTGAVSLSALKARLDTASTARTIAVNAVTDQLKNAKDVAVASDDKLNLISNAIDTMNKGLLYKDNATKIRMETMTPEEIQADSTIPIALKQNELTRRKELAINLSSLQAQNTIVGLAAKKDQTSYALSQLPDAALKDPATINQYSQQRVTEEQQRRIQGGAATTLNEANATDAKIKMRDQMFAQVAKTMTTNQTIELYKQAQANGFAEVDVPGGEKMRLTPQETASLVATRTQLDNASNQMYGTLAANQAGIFDKHDAAVTQIQRLATLGYLGPGDLLKNQASEAELKAHLDNHDWEGAAKVADAKLAASQKLVDDTVAKYDEPARPFMKQFLSTNGNNFASLSQGDAARYMVSQAINGNLLRGTPMESFGGGLAQNIMNIIDKRRALLGGPDAGKKTDSNLIAAMISSGRLDPAQVVREALAMPLPGTDTKETPGGKTIQQAFDEQNFASYVTRSIAQLGATGAESQEYNPFSMLLKSDGNIKDEFMQYNPKAGRYDFSNSTFMRAVEKMDTRMHANGELPGDKHLSDMIIGVLNNSDNMRRWGTDTRARYKVSEGALSVLLSGGNEEHSFGPQIQQLGSHILPSRNIAVEDQRRATDLNDTALSMIKTANAQASQVTNPRDMDVVHTQFGDLIYNKRNVADRERAEEVLSKLRVLSLYKGDPGNVSPFSTQRTGAR